MNKLGQFQQVLTKEMSRKEFLQHVGILVVGAVGITAFVNHFIKLSGYQPRQSTSLSQNNGYGARPYGR